MGAITLGTCAVEGKTFHNHFKDNQVLAPLHAETIVPSMRLNKWGIIGLENITDQTFSLISVFVLVVQLPTLNLKCVFAFIYRKLVYLASGEGIS